MDNEQLLNELQNQMADFTSEMLALERAYNLATTRKGSARAERAIYLQLFRQMEERRARNGD